MARSPTFWASRRALRTTLAGLALAAHGAAAQPSNVLPLEDPEFTLVGVRDAAPAGAPAQVPPLPPLRRPFTPECGPTPEPARPPHNLLRWSFDSSKLRFPRGGFDLYRCCGLGGAPPAGETGWIKLNRERIRPPRSAAEGEAFVTGVGLFPDQGREVKGKRLTPAEWTAYCHLLSEVTGEPATCPVLPPKAAPGPGEAAIAVEQEPLAILQLAALRPEIAALLGLYWVDDNAEGEDCFYRVEGFWDDRTREAVTGPVTAGTLAPPTGLVLAQTPPAGGSFCSQVGGPEVPPPGPTDLAIQLRWSLPDPVLRAPPSESPIAYNVCRRGPGDADFRQINTAHYDPGTGPERVESLILVPRVPRFGARGEPILDASGRPETRTPEVFFEDRLDGKPQHGGVYNYHVTGFSIFGQESPPSAPVSWTLVDSQAPPPPINLRAETQLDPPPASPPTSRVILTFDWTRDHLVRAPDAAFFRVYRRLDGPELEADALGCPLPPGGSPLWTAVGGPIPVDAYEHRFNVVSAQQAELPRPEDEPLPGDEGPLLGDLLPVQRYQLVDTLTLPPDGPPVRHAYYRVVAFDAPAGNASGPSGPARGHVVDNNPASPPTTFQAVFSRSEWDHNVSVHLLWPPAGPAEVTPAGYKLLRSARRPTCSPAAADCPSACDEEGTCTPISCSQGFCGGPDQGPTDARRQEDREGMLTEGVDPFHPGGELRELPKLQSLAELGNLWQRDPGTGAAIPVAPACQRPNPSPTCRDDLKAALGDGNTQYRQDRLPEKASEQVYFYRVIAVSRAGIQEADQGPGTLSPAFPVQIPDFVTPSAPTLASVVGHVRDPQNAGDFDAVEIAWPIGPERDAHLPGAGYAVWRGDVGSEAVVAQDLVPNTGSYQPSSLDPGSCHRFDVRPVNTAGQASGAPLVTALVSGSAPGEITWTPPAGLSQVVVEHRRGEWKAIHPSRLLPAEDPETVGDLRVFTDHFGATIPTLRVWDQPPEAEHDYCYAVQLTDRAGNASALSQVLLGRRLDTTPPDPPGLLTANRVAGEAQLRWSHPEPALRATVKRSSVGPDGPWRTLASQATPEEVPAAGEVGSVFESWRVGAAAEYRFRDLKAAQGRDYWYRVELYDEVGNKSSHDAEKTFLGKDGG